MVDVFISFARDDAMTAKRLQEALSRAGLSVFVDQDVLVAGTDFTSAIADSLRSARAVVVLLSASSRRSKWVQEELASVLEQKAGPLVIPVLLDRQAKDNWVWPLVANRQAIDLTEKPYELDQVALVLQKLLGGKQRAASPERFNDDYPSPASAASPPQPPVARKRNAALALVAFMMLAALAVLATTFLLQPAGAPEDTKLPTPWLMLGAGAVGVIAGYLIRKWRE